MSTVRRHVYGDARRDEVPVPVRGPAQVLRRVEAAAICGTVVDEARPGPITIPVTPRPVNGRAAPIVAAAA